MNLRYVSSEVVEEVFYLFLSRVDKKNALNPEFVEEIIQVLLKIPAGIRCIVIRGSNNFFCAGADLSWVKQGFEQSYDKNLQESTNLIRLLDLIRNCQLPVISIVEGAAIGAGAGIMLASDFVIAEESAVLSFSEVKIGVVPVAIIEMVINAIDLIKAKELLLTGRRLDCAEAYELGMVTRLASGTEEVDQNLADLIELIMLTKPKAISMTKHLIAKSLKNNVDSKYMAQSIAELRLSHEARQGILDFFK